MSRDGLERCRWIDSIDDFVRQHGRSTPRWAVVLTYELTMSTLARVVLPALSRRGRQFRTVVLADQGTLEGALSAESPVLPGAVNLHPVRCKRGGVFHPKLVFLRAGSHVRACFGSANVTDGGLGANLELWTHTESGEILGGIQRFLENVVKSRDLVIDDAARRSVGRALWGLTRAPSASVWSSLDDSFATRLRAGSEKKAKRVSVVSPMYAGPGGVRAARKAVPAASVDLCTNARVIVPGAELFVYEPPHPADQDEDDAEAFPSTLHGKAYVFHPAGRGDAIAWTGSANFTAQALTKSVGGGGNVELMVRGTVPADEAEALELDLRRLFKAAKDASAPEKVVTSAPPRAVATVLAGEIVGAAAERRLVLHCSIKTGRVVLEHQGRRVQVVIRGGRGTVRGAELRRLVPDLDPSAAQALIIHQRVGKRAVPIVVNVPHVPADPAAGGGQASLDTLLEDFLGRIRVPARSSSDDEEEVDDQRDDDDATSDDEDDEIGRRLDEVRHQGELDQLAVKIAMLKRLATASTAAGLERDGMLAEILRAVLAACAPHLQPSLRSLFDNISVGEGS